MAKRKAPSVRVAPSILSADFARLGEEVEAVSEAGADLIHIDVMDGHFVPNLTIGPLVVKAIRGHSKKPFDCHLMIAPADPYIAGFAEAGADIISIHPEAGPNPHRTLQLIRSLGKKAGYVLNPGIEAVRTRIEKSGRDVMLEVDGGINRDTAKDVIAAGADVLVAGTAVFDKGGKGRTHYAGNIARLRG
jgi:ribulose-phosphate 3-epimerase